MKRSAPAHSYRSPEKNSSRSAIWEAIAAELGTSEVRQAHSLILPSTEGAEIPLLLELGFAEERIHAVDRNPALIATAAWRKAYPLVQFYGSELPRACERIAAKGVKLKAANFDLCGCFSTKTLTALRDSARTGVFAARAVVGLTMLKGREESATSAALYLLKRQYGKKGLGCDMRLEVAFQELAASGVTNILSRRCLHGEYQSQTQHMVWAVAVMARLSAYNSDRKAIARQVLGKAYNPIADAAYLRPLLRKPDGAA